MRKIIFLEIIGWMLIGLLILIHFIYRDNLYVLYVGMVGYIVNIVSLVTIGLIVIINLFYYNENK